jgi:predicted small metal-binding protein
MSKHIACDHVVPGCDFEASAGSEEELIRQVAHHAEEKHGVREVTPELAAKVKSAIQER